MARMAVCCLLMLAFLANCVDCGALPPGIKAGLYGDIVGHSDFQVNLRPPEEDKKETEQALDAVMKLEQSKVQAADTEFVEAKQRMLNIERQKISDIVKKGLAPLLAKLSSE